MAAFAMIGAAISGVTFISVPGSVAVDSFSYMQMVAGFTVGQFVVAFVLIPLFYRLRVVSLYEYLDDRFGVASHRTGAWFFFISKILGAALRVYVVCAVLQLLVFDRYGLPFWFNALITMAFVWLYTQQGGVKSPIRSRPSVSWRASSCRSSSSCGGWISPFRIRCAKSPRRPCRGSSSSTIPPRTAISGRCSPRASSCWSA